MTDVGQNRLCAGAWPKEGASAGVEGGAKKGAVRKINFRRKKINLWTS